MPIDLLASIGEGGLVGGGALGGAFIIIKYMSSAIDELRKEVSKIADKMDEVITGHEILKTSFRLEVDHIRLKIIELERRLDRLEEKKSN